MDKFKEPKSTPAKPRGRLVSKKLDGISILPRDIAMAVVENEYYGKHYGAPKTPYLLLVRAIDTESSLLMMRVVGITSQAQKRFSQEAVPLLEINAGLDARIKEYFAIINA